MLQNLQDTTPLNDGTSMPGYGFGCFKAEPEAVSAALGIGYRYLDSASFYKNEKEVGAGIRASGVPRDELYVLSKLWPTDYDTPIRSLDQSLSRLGLNCLDAYLLHWPGTGPERRLKAAETLLKARKQGKFRSFGVSNFQQDHLEDLERALGLIPALNEIQVHPYHQNKELCAYCLQKGIRVVSWGPIGRGEPMNDPVILRLAEAHARTPSQIILRWHLQKGYIPIPKSNQETRIRENADVFGFRLSDQDMQAIDALDRNESIGPDPRTFDGN